MEHFLCDGRCLMAHNPNTHLRVVEVCLDFECSVFCSDGQVLDSKWRTGLVLNRRASGLARFKSSEWVVGTLPGHAVSDRVEELTVRFTNLVISSQLTPRQFQSAVCGCAERCIVGVQSGASRGAWLAWGSEERPSSVAAGWSQRTCKLPRRCRESADWNRHWL